MCVKMNRNLVLVSAVKWFRPFIRANTVASRAEAAAAAAAAAAAIATTTTTATTANSGHLFSTPASFLKSAHLPPPPPSPSLPPSHAAQLPTLLLHHKAALWRHSPQGKPASLPAVRNCNVRPQVAHALLLYGPQTLQQIELYARAVFAAFKNVTLYSCTCAATLQAMAQA